MPPQPTTKKGLLIALIGVIIVAALIIWGLKSAKQPTTVTPADETPTVTADWPSKAVKKQTITDNTQGMTISAEYPETGRADITEKLKGFVEDQIATFKNDSANIPVDARAVTLDISYDEQQNNLADNYSFSIYSDTGGAHGIEVTRTFSFTSTGEQITLDKLFIDKTKGLDLVSDYVKQELLKRDFADSKWISEGAAPTDENYQTFIVTETGLTFIFDPYQVAAYAAGAQTVAVPVSAFRSEANPDIFK